SSRFVIEAELSLERGVMVLYGASGTGKSLTVAALAGLIEPQQGFIRQEQVALPDFLANRFGSAYQQSRQVESIS
ncbi:MAG: ATP-binding cassette domain-containing protein, partial [Proteobacteria bacterium]|nr:ATP-binding cassette domain-containing protein [Pseudomonadota bacterium]